MEKHPVIIIGAGPAGIGVAALLAQANIPALILERGRIGESFHLWSKETRFISPSFTGNFFGAVDLNAITPDSSPAFSFRQEHVSGTQYAGYLKNIAEFYQLKIQNGVNVTAIKVTQSGDIRLTAGKKNIYCQHLIWAGGEFQYPKHIPHTMRVKKSYQDMPTGNHVIIGGSESGMEAAYNLVQQGSNVTVIDKQAPWASRISDSSYGLSPYTFERLMSLQDAGKVKLIAEHVTSITKDTVSTENTNLPISYPPINATGFNMEKSLAGKIFDFVDNYPQLTSTDESTKYKNVYLVGPTVKHDNALFCFIYKYRQRFAVVVRDILTKRNEQSSVIEAYAKQGFLLDDLSCCDEECAC